MCISISFAAGIRRPKPETGQIRGEVSPSASRRLGPFGDWIGMSSATKVEVEVYRVSK
jgi:hypothetical protein